MKTRTHTLETRSGSPIERWKRLMVACALSLIVACGSPVGPPDPDESAFRGGEGEPEVGTPLIPRELDDDEWRREGSGEGDDRRKWRW